MKFIKKNLWAMVLVLLFTIVPVVSLAQATTPAASVPLKNPLGDNGPSSIQAFLVKILEGAIKIGIPIVALAIIYCGFLFVKAQGNPEEITKAKEALMYTLIGAAILLGAVAISRLIIDTVTSIAA